MTMLRYLNIILVSYIEISFLDVLFYTTQFTVLHYLQLSFDWTNEVIQNIL